MARVPQYTAPLLKHGTLIEAAASSAAKSLTSIGPASSFAYMRSTLLPSAFNCRYCQHSRGLSHGDWERL